MADPVKQRIISVKVDNANIGEYVKVSNITTGEQAYARLQGSDKSALVNSGDDFTWSNEDVIQGEIHGRLNGVARGKIQAGGLSLTIVATADTSTPGADL